MNFPSTREFEFSVNEFNEYEESLESKVERLMETRLSPYSIRMWDELGDVMCDKEKELAALLAKGNKLTMEELGKLVFDAMTERCRDAALYQLGE